MSKNKRQNRRRRRRQRREERRQRRRQRREERRQQRRYLILRPFAPLMRLMIKRKGVTPKPVKPFKDLFYQFVEVFNLHKKVSYGDLPPEITLSDNAIPPIPPEAIPMIVNAITKLLAGFKKNNKGDEEVEDAVKETEDNITKEEKSSSGGINWGLVGGIFGGLVILIILFFAIKKK